MKGQIFLGEDEFIRKFKELLANKKGLKEIARCQRYVARPELTRIFMDVRKRSRWKEAVYKAHVRFGYTLKKIADYLRIHYTTVSKIVKEVEGRN